MEQTIGKRIMENRKRLGLTQDQLAEQLGVTAQAVSKWENDQSCPDIGLLSRLADIFGITTDVLLGREPQEQVHYAEVVEESAPTQKSDVTAKMGNFEFKWAAGKKSALGFAIFVLAFGGLFLASQLLSWEHDFWDLLWPTALFVFGIFGLFPKFSFFYLGCTLFGGFFLAKLFVDIPVQWDSGVLWAVLILLFGISLLADALRRPKKPTVKMAFNNDNKKSTYEYNNDTDHFEIEGSFGSFHQLVTLETLRSGDIDVNFGDYTVELSDTMTIAPGCRIDADCSFGQLTVLVPKKIAVKSVTSNAFGAFDVQGTPDAQPQAELVLEANSNFGNIVVKYI